MNYYKKRVTLTYKKLKYQSSVEKKCCLQCGENECNGGGTYGNKAYVLYILTGILERIASIIGNFFAYNRQF